MVAIVNGNELGIAAGVLGQTVGQTQYGQQPTGVYVNAATGNLVVQNNDVNLTGVGSDLTVTQTYNSDGSQLGAQGWLIGTGKQITLTSGTLDQAGSTIVHTLQDGSMVVYQYNAAQGDYVSDDASAENGLISATATGWTYVDSSTQVTETYDQSGRMVTSSDASGNTTSYTYEGTSNQLASIVDASGESVQFGYNAQGQLTSLSEVVVGGTNQTLVNYAYDSLGRLSQISVMPNQTGGTNYVTTYGYLGTGDQLTSLQQSDGTQLSFTYTQTTSGTWYISQIKDGAGNITQISQAPGGSINQYVTAPVSSNASLTQQSTQNYYTVQAGDDWQTIAQTLYGSAQAASALQQAMGSVNLVAGMLMTVPSSLQYVAVVGQSGSTVITGPDGNSTTYAYDGVGHVTSVAQTVGIAGVNQQVVQSHYQYSSNGQLLSQTNPDGATTTYSYDAQGNLATETDPEGNETTYRYNSTGQVVASTTYQFAVVSNENASQAGIAATRRTIYNAQGNLLYTIGATGDVVAYTYNASGERIAEIDYQGASYTISGLTPNQDISVSAIETWQATQDPTQTQLTHYSYDFRGNLSSVTTYASVDSNGNGVGASTTHYVYAANGQLLQSINANGGQSHYTYDALGQLVSSTNALGVVSTVQYNDAANSVTTTLSTGLVTTQLRDADGNIIETSTTSTTAGAALSTTSNYYDADGRLRASTDATGVTTWYFYDALGREDAKVDGNGDVTQYVYDAAGLQVETIHYAQTVGSASWVTPQGTPAIAQYTTLAQILPASTAQDQHQWNVYNTDGLLAYTVDGAGDVTGYQYDSNGRQTAQIAYANPLNISTLITNTSTGQALTATEINVTPSINDRITRTMYDAAGKLIAKADPNGAVTSYSYDDAGNLTSQTTYATTVTPSQLADPQLWDGNTPLAQLLPAASAADRTTLYFYNASGQQVGNINSDDYLTTTTYDADGNVASITLHAQAVSYTTGETLAQISPASLPGDATTTYQYNTDNLLESETSAQGVVTTYSYDTNGNLLQTSVDAGQADVRSDTKQYNVQGELVAELDGVGSAALAAATTPTDVAQVWASYATHYTYDAAGRQITSTNAEGNTTYYYYDGAGHNVYTVNPDGDITHNNYNGIGQLTSTVHLATQIATTNLAGGIVTSALTNQIATIANALADRTVSYTYDGAGRLLSTTDALGYTTTQNYDAFGNVIEVQQQLSASQTTVVQTSYDVDGNKVQTIEDPSGIDTLTTASFNTFDEQMTSTDADGHTTTYVRNNLGQITEKIDATGAKSFYSYDAQGRVLSTTNADGNTTTYQYDDATRTGTVTQPSGANTITVSNAFGDVVSSTDANGNIITNTYDQDGHQLSSAGATGGTTTQQYSVLGQLIANTNADGVTTTDTYDAAGFLATQTLGSTGAVSTTQYAHNAFGEVNVATNANGNNVYTQYENNGNATQVNVTTGQSADVSANIVSSTSYQYNAISQIVEQQDGNVAGSQTVENKYDALGRLVAQISDPAGLALTTTYHYDAAGNLIAKTNPTGATTTYIYDADNRQTYAIDANGNVNQTEYDAAGNVVEQLNYQEANYVETVQSGNGSVSVSAGTIPLANAADTQTLMSDFAGNNMTDMLEIQHAADGTAVATEWIATQSGYTQGPSTVLGQWTAGTQYMFGQTATGTGTALIEIQNINGQTVATRWTVGATGLTKSDQTTLGIWSANNTFKYGDVTGTGALDLMQVSVMTDTRSYSVTRWIAGASGVGFTQGASYAGSNSGELFASSPVQVEFQDMGGAGKLSLLIPWTDDDSEYSFYQISVNSDGSLANVTSGFNRSLVIAAGNGTFPAIAFYAQLSLKNDPNNTGGSVGLVYADSVDGVTQFESLVASTGTTIKVSLGTPKLNQQFFAADVDGNGRSDLVQIWENAQEQAVSSVWYSNVQGSGYVQGADTVLGTWQPGATYQLADVNGDGRADIVASWTATNGSTMVSTWYSTGIGFSQTTNWSADTQTVLGDFTGNGMTDMLEIQHAADGTAVATEWIATQSGYIQGPSTVLGSWSAGTQYQFGQTAGGVTNNALVSIQNMEGKTVVTRWTVGASGLTQAGQTTLGIWSANNSYQYGDVTGAGEFDLMEVIVTGTHTATVTRWIASASGFTQGASLPINITNNFNVTINSPDQIELQDVTGKGVLALVLPFTYSSYHGFYQVNLNSDGSLALASNGLAVLNYANYSSTVYAQLSLSNDPNSPGEGMGLVYDNGAGAMSFESITPSTGASSTILLGVPKLNQQFFAGDVSGSGRSDLVQLWENEKGQAVASVWYSNANGSGYTQGADTVLGTWQPGVAYHVVDANDDGRVDIEANWAAANGSLVVSTWYSTGSGFSQSGNWAADTQTLMSDFAGNGKADMLKIQHAADGTAVATEWIATQSGYAQGASTVLGQWQAETQYQFGQTSAGSGNALIEIQDVNGYTTITRWTVGASGLMQSDQTTLGIWSANNTFKYGDVTGTGELDLMQVSVTGAESFSVTRWIAGTNGVGFTQGATIVGGIYWQQLISSPEQIEFQDVGGIGKLSLLIPWADTPSEYGLSQVTVNSDGSLANVSTGLTTTQRVNANSVIYAQLSLNNDPNNTGDGVGLVYADSTDGVTLFQSLVASTGASISISLGAPKLNQQFFAADVDGNGRSDLVQIWENAQGLAVSSVWYSNAQSSVYTQGADTVLGAWQAGATYQLADANGDSRADIVASWIAADGSTMVGTWYSTGSGFNQTGNWSADTQTVMGDFTGNGMTDMLEIQHAADGTAVATEWIATQSGYTQGPSTVLGPWTAGTEYQFGQTTGGVASNALVSIQNIEGKAVSTRWLVGASGLTKSDQTTLGLWSINNSFQYGDVTGKGAYDLMEVAVTGTHSATVTRWIAGTSGFTQGASLLINSGYIGVNSPAQIAMQDVSGTGKLAVLIPWSYSTDFHGFYQVNLNSDGSLALASSGLTAENYVTNSSIIYAQLSLKNDLDNFGEGIGLIYGNGAGAMSFESILPSAGAMTYTSGVSSNAVTSTTSLGIPKLNQQFFASDVNGNCRSDLVQIWENAQGQAVASVWYSKADGSGYTQGADTVLGTWQASAIYQVADVNGDDRADIVASWTTATGSTAVNTWYSTGSGFSQSGNWSGDTQTLMSDFAGNGKADMLEIQHAANGTAVATEWIATQSGYTQGPLTVLGQWVAGTQYQFGQTSAGTGNALVAIANVNGQTVVTRWTVGTTGLTQEDQTTLGVWLANNAFQYGDVTGTGELDLMEVSSTGVENVTTIGTDSVKVTRWIAGATGAGFTQGASLNLTYPLGAGGFISPIALQDVSGTGNLSVLIPWTYPTNLYGFDQVSVSSTGTLTSVSSGLTGVKYGASTFNTVYAQFSLSNDPNSTGKGMGIVYANSSGAMNFEALIPSTGAMITVSLGASQLNQQFIVGDVDGNGRSDLVQIWENAQGQAIASVWYSNAQGSAYAQGANTILGAWQAGASYRLANVNGDGRAAIVATSTAASGSTVVSTWYSTGTGFSQNGNWSADTQTVMGNFTGNGMTDMLEIQHVGDGTAVATEWIA
ncbi:DUF6531 domain-containing protein, partial [Solimicrobium silvestre]|uniref:DUF6531 domain-containing protein n=1 Tax=Solimicrobium silvestre TaxID=2099400 RepID=UPI00105727C6